MIIVIALILMEKSILLVSNQDSVPPTVCEILRVLLFPFDVTANVYIPRLPESLSGILVVFCFLYYYQFKKLNYL